MIFTNYQNMEPGSAPNTPLFLSIPFAMLLIIDRALFLSGALPKAFIQSRTIVTILAIFALVMSAIFS